MSATLKKNTSQRIVWTHEYENNLLDLWEEKIEELRGSRKNFHVYQEIAASMQQIGFPGTWADIRTKVDNLTRKYKQEKSRIGPTGGAPSTWVHYNKVHGILGAFKVHNIEASMHESTNISNLSSELDPNASCSSYCDEEYQHPKKRKTKRDTNSELVRLAQERMVSAWHLFQYICCCFCKKKGFLENYADGKQHCIFVVVKFLSCAFR